MMHASAVNLLVVDDNDGQRKALTATLADLDVTLVEAASGRAALRYLLQQEFAAIIMDVNMPGLNGFDTAELIRERRSSEHTPIIFVTAYSDDTHAARGYSLGAVDYILAPVQPNVLRAKVSVFVDLYKKSQQLTRQREALRRYAAQLQQLSEASLAINSAQSVEEVLRIVADNAARIVGAHQASTSAAVQDDSVAFTATHLSEKYGGARSILTSSPPPILASGMPHPLRMTEAEMNGCPAALLSPPEIVKGVPMHGWLAVPLTGRDGRSMGLAQLSEKVEGEFTAEDEGILVQLAQMASIAVENTLTSEAREANRLKDEFLGVLSHELRTPLQAMLTWVSILRREKVDASMSARGLEVIERSARSQAQLIEDLIDVSRIIRGQLRLESEPVELKKVIALALETLKPAAGAKGIQIAWAPSNADCVVVGDANRLQQVVWNLISNAVKFTPDQGRVAIQLQEEDQRYHIQVRDTGRGIPAEFLPHVFERFRQADSTTGRQHGGLGLGLAIVRHLVELHGGTVRADNAPDGAGAIFTVTLPRLTHAAVPLRYLAVPGADSQKTLTVTNGIRLDGIQVVVVEDEKDAREGLTTALQLFGAEVVAVSSAAAALARLEHRQPHVLLSDIAMSGEDGYSLIRKIRAREAERGGHLPAAALTAYVRAEDRATALLAGFDTHVQKPVQPVDLAMLVKRLAERTSIVPA